MRELIREALRDKVFASKLKITNSEQEVFQLFEQRGIVLQEDQLKSIMKADLEELDVDTLDGVVGGYIEFKEPGAPAESTKKPIKGPELFV